MSLQTSILSALEASACFDGFSLCHAATGAQLNSTSAPRQNRREFSKIKQVGLSSNRGKLLYIMVLIRIQVQQSPSHCLQGSVAQSDTFYVDFSPMQEDPSKLEGLRQACLAEAARIIRASEGGLASDSESDGSASESEHESEELKALSDANLETLEANEYDQVSEGGYAFRLVCGRQETKAIAKAVLELASKKS